MCVESELNNITKVMENSETLNFFGLAENKHKTTWSIQTVNTVQCNTIKESVPNVIKLREKNEVEKPNEYETGDLMNRSGTMNNIIDFWYYNLVCEWVVSGWWVGGGRGRRLERDHERWRK